MSNEQVSMTNAINEFKKASKELTFKEQDLNRVVQPRLQSLIEKKDIQGLHDLVEMMPLGYTGSRRMYEAMERIDEEKEKGGCSFYSKRRKQ